MDHFAYEALYFWRVRFIKYISRETREWDVTLVYLRLNPYKSNDAVNKMLITII